ncbi:MAG TPA: DNA-3-methyladenine glycosylase 2 family protein, partial [Mycobacterium sp.]|nr:DNA-3-methyladenine glycosylase 2 family protein [Mycobacterium sp.]
LGAYDDVSGFSPAEPTIGAAHQRLPHLRIGRTHRVLEALVPAVLEQRVYGMDARRAWRALVTKFGAPAPGPAPAHMRVPPSGEVWRRIPSWEFHRANVDPGRARTIVGCAQRADSLERLVNRAPERARAALMSLPGVGEWTAAETAQRAFGDADALSVGDYHLASMVGWRLLGEPIDDPAMVELLEPLRPHRYRAVRLLEVTGPARPPRRAARQAIPKLAEW